jgi:ketosteroid isomerase-like protein
MLGAVFLGHPGCVATMRDLGVFVSEPSTSVRMRAAQEFAIRMGHVDIEQLKQYLSPNVVYRVPGRQALAGSFHGIDEVFAHLHALAERTGGTFNPYKFEDWLMGANSVAAVVDVHIQEPGAILTERILFLFGFDGSDLISEIGVFFQNEGAIERFFAI